MKNQNFCPSAVSKVDVPIDDCPTKNDIKCPTGGNHYVYQYEVKGFN